jgi:hypothetical protein
MSVRQGILGVIAVGLIMLLLSFAGIISDFLAGLKLDMDGLLLLSVSLMMALIFAAMLFFLIKQSGLLGGRKLEDQAAAGQK